MYAPRPLVRRSCVRRGIARTAALVPLLAAVASSAAAQSALPRFERADCLVNGDWASDVRRECGWLVVPESRDRPSPNVVRLAVEVFRAREPSGAPALVLLHGGPGGPGGIRLYSAGIARSSFPRSRDVVVYDQRGAGLSEPRLCPAYDRTADSVYALPESAETIAALRESRRACIAELDAKGIDRLAYNTSASAADLVDLRRTLGYASWDVRASSYGARLAQELMLRDGPALHAVVLASPVGRGVPVGAEQPMSTQRAFERVFAACAAQAACHEAFPDLEADFYAAYDALRTSAVGVAMPGRSDSVHLDGPHLVAGLREMTQDRTRLGRIPLVVHELRSGDRLRAAREIVGNASAPRTLAGRAMRELVTCYDAYGPAFLAALDSINSLVRPPFRRVRERECEEWLPRFAEPSARVPVRSDVPTLIMTGYFDDRTPTTQARRIAATLGRAFVVELPDEAHDARPSPCDAAIVNRFLQEPTRMPDSSCIETIPAVAFATTW